MRTQAQRRGKNDLLGNSWRYLPPRHSSFRVPNANLVLEQWIATTPQLLVFSITIEFTQRTFQENHSINQEQQHIG